MQLIKVFTCGNVDDGKSTLLGRLLLDSEAISVDVLHQLTEQGGGTPNLALLTDGLRAERSMGITIDVAYKFFTTEQTHYILVDTPGHQEYTRNMYAGASECSMAIVLIDVKKTIEAQTKKHIEILQALGIKRLIFACNKMDDVGFEEHSFQARKKEVLSCLNPASLLQMNWIPMSALLGDNVVMASLNMPWYSGPTLLECMETMALEKEAKEEGALLEIQGVLRNTVFGRVLQGKITPNDSLKRGGDFLEIKDLCVNGKPRTLAGKDDQISFSLQSTAQIRRGQYWSRDSLIQGFAFEVELCWFAIEVNDLQKDILVQRGTTLHHAQLTFQGPMETNDLQKLTLTLKQPLDILENRISSKLERVLIIDPNSNETLAAGIIINLVK